MALTALTVSVGEICKKMDMNIYAWEQTLIYFTQKIITSADTQLFGNISLQEVHIRDRGLP
jgi:hypothetical protein